MLPDIWRMAHRRARPRRSSEVDAAPLAALQRGVAHHLEADRWFHALPLLSDGEASLIQAIKRAGCAAPRLTLLAHPLWEMCLDGALVRRLSADAVLKTLREGLSSTSDALAAVASLQGLDEALGVDRPAFDTQVARLCAAIAEGPWVRAYASPEGLALCVDGIRRRLGLSSLDRDELARLSAAIASVSSQAEAALDALLLQRQAALMGELLPVGTTL